MSSYFFRFSLVIFFMFGANQITVQSNDWVNPQVDGFNTNPEKATAISLPDIESAQHINIERSNRINWTPPSKPHEEFRIYPDNYKYQFRIIPVELENNLADKDLNYTLINY